MSSIYDFSLLEVNRYISVKYYNVIIIAETAGSHEKVIRTLSILAGPSLDSREKRWLLSMRTSRAGSGIDGPVPTWAGSWSIHEPEHQMMLNASSA